VVPSTVPSMGFGVVVESARTVPAIVVIPTIMTAPNLVITRISDFPVFDGHAVVMC
jgi:hypothetical protein